ncbi:endonuclease/exonuclease/phosphatase family protein [Thalassotalea sp. PP2-459]|uniref:endonuclease/exonuclease/phosphatase family protein n=1 Tax=Thalassotalea sp. PP2-459 TaxID=1742724 RepID=UPI0015882393|nr:endonuclease/exonuclease/phosphatase family protein [Thalassotalea sp. PP2-459]
MSKVCLLTVVFVCSVLSSVSVTAAKAVPLKSSLLKVMTYNVRHGTDLHGEISITKQAAFIKQHNVDLLALQEIDQETKRFKGVNQTEYFSNTLSLNGLFQPFMTFDGGQYGIAAFSKLPILKSKSITLPNGLEPRVFPQLLINVEKQPLLFIPIHFDWPSEDRARFEQATQLLSQLDIKLPIVLAGDFNDYPDSRTIALFKDAGFSFIVNNTSTFLGPNEGGKSVVEIDFIAVRSGQTTSLSLLESFVFDQHIFSDHAAVLSSILVTQKQINTAY